MEMLEYFSKNKEAMQIFDAFSSNEFECFVVGGCVRDILINKIPHDIDFCTNATPEQMIDVAKWIHKNYQPCEVIPVGEKFGTMAYHFPETGNIYEITTFRNDGRYEDSRHPKEVNYSDNVFDDLKRRDFTCNAIAWSPLTGFVDPFHGIGDLVCQEIRCVGNPIDRFNEDALRIIRLLRFALKYEFTINTETYKAAIKNVHTLNLVAKERLGKELTQIFNMNTFTNTNKRVRKLMDEILNEITPVVAEDSDWVFGVHNYLLKWYFSFNCDSALPEVFISKLNKFAVGSEIVNGCMNLRAAYNFYNICEVKDSIKVLEFLETSDERKAFLECIVPGTPKYNKIIEAIVNNYAYSIKQLTINGNDIMAITGMKPGPEVKKILNQCLDAVIENQEHNSRKFLCDYVAKIYSLKMVISIDL